MVVAFQNFEIDVDSDGDDDDVSEMEVIDVEEFFVKYKNLYVAMMTHCYVVNICQAVKNVGSRSVIRSKRTVTNRFENIEISRLSKFHPLVFKALIVCHLYRCQCR